MVGQGQDEDDVPLAEGGWAVGVDRQRPDRPAVDDQRRRDQGPDPDLGDQAVTPLGVLEAVVVGVVVGPLDLAQRDRLGDEAAALASPGLEGRPPALDAQFGHARLEREAEPPVVVEEADERAVRLQEEDRLVDRPLEDARDVRPAIGPRGGHGRSRSARRGGRPV